MIENMMLSFEFKKFDYFSFLTVAVHKFDKSLNHWKKDRSSLMSS
jgi:hypothetical protein